MLTKVRDNAGPSNLFLDEQSLLKIEVADPPVKTLL